MADDFDNSDEIQNLTDSELRQYILTELKSQKALDVNDITVSVKSGAVTISGRVGTESERRIADHVMTDVISVQEFDNQLVVDENARAQSPDAIDEHIVDEEEHSGLLLGDAPVPYTAESEHLADTDDDESIGTHDVHKAIESAEPWIPPESPTPEGATGQEDGRLGADSEH